MELAKLGKRHVVTVTSETSLEDTARLMRERHVGDVVVVDRQGDKEIPIGILTDRDIVMSTIALGAPPNALAAGDVMTRGMVVAQEKESLRTIINLMKENGVKRIPLVNKEGSLCGIIALEDVVSLLTAELSALAEVGKREREVELERRRKLA